jgi:hypothetical protein
MDRPLTENEDVTDCNCPYQIVSQGDAGVVFQELDPQEEYFPMVARDYDQAFFGVPPKAIRPAAPQPDFDSGSVTADNVIPNPAASQSADTSSDGQYTRTATNNTDGEQEGENSSLMAVSL